MSAIENMIVRRTTAEASGPGLAQLWSFRELMRSLVVRNLKVKYQRSVLGFLWTLLNPLLTAGALIVVFSAVVRVPVENYWAFLLSGYFVWNFTSQTMNAGTTLLAENGTLRRSVAFPTEALILGAAISRLVEFLVETASAILLIVLFHHHGLPASLLLLPLLIVLQVLTVVGLTMAIATLSAFYHDVKHAVPVALLMAFYISPVFYPVSLVPEKFRALYHLNPMAALLTSYQTVLFEGRMPSAMLLGETVVGALLIGGLGYAIFNRYKTILAEIV